MFDKPAAYGTPFHRKLDEVAQGVPVQLDDLSLQIDHGLVDAHVIPPILTAEGREFLARLGPFPPGR